MARGRKKVRNVVTKVEEQEQEDRISSLSDDLLHRILSMNPINAKVAVQTSQFSTRWRHVWKSLSHLSFHRLSFTNMSHFSNFLNKFLAHRNHSSDLIAISLDCPSSSGVIQRSLLRKIALYASSHNAQILNICCEVSLTGLPLSIFTSQSLKHLRISSPLRESRAPKSPWILPSLTTLFLQEVSFDSAGKSISLFSSLLNLKTLTLIDCCTTGVEVFNIVSPRLENLALTISPYWKSPSEIVISAPKLSGLEYKGRKAPRISGNHLHFLEKVYIDIEFDRLYDNFGWKQRVFRDIVDVFFHQLRNATFLTITSQTVGLLTFIFELLGNQPSPFHKLKCLKIVKSHSWNNLFLSTRVLTHLCNSSPGATVINGCRNYFQVP